MSTRLSSAQRPDNKLHQGRAVSPHHLVEVAVERLGGAPLIVKVRFRHMVSRATYRRIKRDFFRLHRQFVLAVENRCPYSLHMLLLGPASLTQFRQTRSVDRPPLVAPEATSKRPLADKLADPATGALS